MFGSKKRIKFLQNEVKKKPRKSRAGATNSRHKSSRRNKINRLLNRKMGMHMRFNKENDSYQILSTTSFSEKINNKIARHYPNLLTSNEIDDKTVYDFFRYLQTQNETRKNSSHSKRRKIAFYDPQHFDKGQIRERFLNHLKVTQSKSWVAFRKALKEAEVIYFPISKRLDSDNPHTQNHWFLVTATKEKKGKTTTYTLKGVDGFNLQQEQTELFEQVKTVINALYPKKRFKYTTQYYQIPSQTGVIDCGMVVCFAAALIALGLQGELVLSELKHFQTNDCNYHALRQYCARKLFELTNQSTSIEPVIDLVEDLEEDDQDVVEIVNQAVIETINSASDEEVEKNPPSPEIIVIEKPAKTKLFAYPNQFKPKVKPQIIVIDEEEPLNEVSPRPSLSKNKR